MSRARLSGRRLGCLIGAVGGLVFVLTDASGLPEARALRLLGVAVFAATMVAVRRGADDGSTPRSPHALRVYVACVAGEVLAIPAGATALNATDHDQLVRIWVVLVVGVHFLPFARAFLAPTFAWLGGALILTAAAGSVVALVGSDAEPAARWTTVAAGFELLGWALCGAVSSDRSPSRPGRPSSQATRPPR